MEHKRRVVIEFKLGHVLPFVAVLLHPIILGTEAFVVLVVVKLSARNIGKIAETFTDSDQYVYNDVKVLTVKFHKLATFQLVIVSHLSNWIRFCFFAQVSFYFNLLYCDLVLVYYFGQFVLDQGKHLKNLRFFGPITVARFFKLCH